MNVSNSSEGGTAPLVVGGCRGGGGTGRGAEAGALPGHAGGQEAACSPTQGGEDPWSQLDLPQRVWEGRSPLPWLHSYVSFGREGESRAAARGTLRPGSGTASVCILSSPGTLAQVTAPGTCHQALPSPAPHWLCGGLGLGSSHHLAAQEHPQAAGTATTRDQQRRLV